VVDCAIACLTSHTVTLNFGRAKAVSSSGKRPVDYNQPIVQQAIGSRGY
jgi:hypothetical protein